MWGIQIVFAWLIAVDLPGRIIRNSSKIKQDRGDSLINLSWGQTYVTKQELFWLGCQPQCKIGLFCCSLINVLENNCMFGVCFCHWFHFGFASEESCKMQTVFYYSCHHQFTMMMWTNYRLCLWASAYINLIQPHWSFVSYYLADIEMCCFTDSIRQLDHRERCIQWNKLAIWVLFSQDCRGSHCN